MNERPEPEHERKSRFGWKNQPPPSKARVALWIVVGGVGLYYLGSGIFGLLTH